MPTKTEVRELKARAHHLKPVVMVGQHGLTENVLAEIDNALNIHELIKVKISGGDKAERKATTESICETTDAHFIHQIGNISILYRENDKDDT